MTDQPRRNQVSPEVLPDGEAKPDEPVKTQPLAGDGEVIESQMLKFQHGVLGCCSKPDCMCCAIFMDAYICPCFVYGSMWKKSSEEERCLQDFCYPCCGFLLGFPIAYPCLLGFLRTRYRNGSHFFITRNLQKNYSFKKSFIPLKEPKKILMIKNGLTMLLLAFVRAVF